MKNPKNATEKPVVNQKRKFVKVILVDNANSIMSCGGSWMCNESK